MKHQLQKKSFFKINESATPINDTEKKLLKSRKKPNAIAARSIIHAGSGHKYWGGFSEDVQNEIEGLAKEINDILFTPKYDPPIKTLDLPLAGKGYSAQTLELIFNLVNLANNIKVEDKKMAGEHDLSEDPTGHKTVTFLQQSKKILNRMTGNGSASLGLHPAVYFYSEAGRYQVTAFMTCLEIIKDFELHRSYEKFTSIRRDFEDFLVKYKILISQVVLKYGSGVKSYRRLFRLFKLIIDSFVDGKKEGEILTLIISEPEFSSLRPEEIEVSPTRRKDFSPETKSMIYMRTALASPIRCALCGGYIHTKGIQIDHTDDKKNGGIGHADNGQLTHPFCNSVKDKLFKG